MPLNVAVQMDHIARLTIRGDSTFALMLEGERRGHQLFHYTPDRLAMRDGRVEARRRAGQRARRRGRPLHARAGRARRPFDASTWCCCARTRPSTWATSPPPIILERIQPKTLVVNDPAQRAQRAGKALRHRIPRADAADADHPRPRARSRASARSTATSSSSRSTAMAAPASSASAGGDENLGVAARTLRDDLPRALSSSSATCRRCGRATSASSSSRARRSAPSTACRRRARRAPTCMSAAGRSRSR